MTIDAAIDAALDAARAAYFATYDDTLASIDAADADYLATRAYLAAYVAARAEYLTQLTTQEWRTS